MLRDVVRQDAPYRLMLCNSPSSVILSPERAKNLYEGLLYQ